MAEKLTPRNARREKQLVLMRYTRSQSGNHSLFIDDAVYVSEWRDVDGRRVVEQFRIPRRDFNRLIDWYNAPQTLHRSAPKARSKKRTRAALRSIDGAS